jgi:hypothetical protein
LGSDSLPIRAPHFSHSWTMRPVWSTGPSVARASSHAGAVRRPVHADALDVDALMQTPTSALGFARAVAANDNPLMPPPGSRRPV